MTDIQFRDDFDVDLVDSMGTDASLCRAARVSTLGASSLNSDADAGLISYLMRNRHGSPFEHGSMTFRITAPIFVWREFMRHRIGFSYNEQSGRYMEMEPVFYIPRAERPLMQQGKPGHYEFVKGHVEQRVELSKTFRQAYSITWERYQRLLGEGIAKEVARMCLPVGIYSTAYVTCNPRSLMSFLSLRTKDPESTFPSYPQWEIERVSLSMERHFIALYPLTAVAFQDHGRVSP